VRQEESYVLSVPLDSPLPTPKRATPNSKAPAGFRPSNLRPFTSPVPEGVMDTPSELTLTPRSMLDTPLCFERSNSDKEPDQQPRLTPYVTW
jgi:hypothetical protein